MALLNQLHPGLQRFIAENWNVSGLKAIQKEAIPPLLEGRDAIIEAPTAGGKTESVLFPVLTRVARDRLPGVRILYLAPLRALLNNLQNRGEEYAQLCHLRAFKWHGDVSQKEKFDALSDPPELLMTTPESTEAILLRKSAWQRLFKNLSVVIIDEAHNFAAGDRGGHLLCLLERVETAAELLPQRIALSATVGNPDALLEWLAGSTRKPGLRIHVPSTQMTRDFKVKHFDANSESDETPPHERASFRRFNALANLLPGYRSIVFVPSRAKAEGIAKAFAKYRPDSGRDLRIRTHHSNVSKFFREEAEALIQVSQEGGIDAIISTSTLELGIDIGELDRVVQMDALASPSSFLQRVGRTGRRPGHPQFFRGYTLTDRDLLLLVATVNLGLHHRSETLDLPTRAFHLLVHQLLCLALQEHGIAPDVSWEMIRNAHCFSSIRRHEFDLLIRHMVKRDYLREVDGVLVTGDRTEKEYLGANWRKLFAVFETAPFYDVLYARMQVGTLSASFVESLTIPFFFVLAGRLWKAEKIDTKAHRVQAIPSNEGEAPKWDPSWGFDVPFETAQEVGLLLHGDTIPAYLNDEGKDRIRALQRAVRSLLWIPGQVLIVPQGPIKTSILTFAGDRINRSLAIALSLNGAGDSSANYQEVRLKTRGDLHGRGVTLIQETLDKLRFGNWNDPSYLSTALEVGCPRVRFSPFSKCLPPELAARTLVERNLDVLGLLRLLTSSQ